MSAKLINYRAITDNQALVLSTGATPKVSLYLDETATILFVDDEGNTHSDKVIGSINYTEPHNNEDQTQVVNGYLKLSFIDGTHAIITDHVDVVYYTMVAVPFKPRKFN